MTLIIPRGDAGTVIANMPELELSQLLPWASFILIASLVLIIISAFALEHWILPKLYPTIYPFIEAADDGSKSHEPSAAKTAAAPLGRDRKRKSFVYSHLAGVVKLSLMLVMAYPCARIFFGPDDFTVPLYPGSAVTLGDMALVSMQVYCAYYIWELCYRAGHASYINMLHHVGLLTFGQVSVAMCSNWRAYDGAAVDFYMCMVWGVFDLVSEGPVHLVLVLRRVVLDSRRTPANVRRLGHFIIASSVWCIACTAAEVAVTVYLLQQSWHRWAGVWHYIVPIFFAMWCIAQTWGSKQIFQMGLSHRRQGLRMPAQRLPALRAGARAGPEDEDDDATIPITQKDIVLTSSAELSNSSSDTLRSPPPSTSPGSC